MSKQLYYCSKPFFAQELPTPGFLFAYPNDTTKHIVTNDIFEKSLISWCSQFCSKNKLFLDIGAHAGTYSILLADYCSKVYAFEAQRRTYYQLCGGIAINGKSDKIIAHHCALTSDDMNGKTLILNIVSEDGGGSSICDDLPQTKNPIKQESVNARSLDSFNLQNIGFLKLDVEGAELNVLKGSVLTLKNSQYPPFVFEVWPDQWYQEKKNKLCNFITSIGYKIVPITGVNNMFLANYNN